MKNSFTVKVKIKQCHYRPGQALRVPGVWGSQISRQSAHKSGKVVSLTHRPPLPPGNIPGTHFCWRISRPQDQSAAGRIMSMTPSGIEHTNFRLVAQCHNQLLHRAPFSFSVIINILVATEHGLITWSQCHNILIISFKGTYVLTWTHIFLYTFFQTYK
jgi:hypothetical protein